MAAPPIVKQDGPKKPQKRKGHYYAQIHRKALPLEVYPLPVFHPTQPLSLLQLVWTVLHQWLSPPTSRPAHNYLGYLSAETHAVHITDPLHVRALWEQGFFGKGSLSRSEPTWLDREQSRIAARNQGATTAEEATKARREERRLFKLERARLERERIDSQRKIEQGLPADASVLDVEKSLEKSAEDENILETKIDPLVGTVSSKNSPYKNSDSLQADFDVDVEQLQPIQQQEHLQLTFEEAYFLSFGLGVLDVSQGKPFAAISKSTDLFNTFQQLSKLDSQSPPAMDDRFILNYVVYHHFRSLGWVVRPGVKFSIDYLLYNRGPVFSHAEFAVLIMPSYSDPYWHSTQGIASRKLEDQKDWWWLHCINRVQSQVKKTLVLCYVDIPPPQDGLLEQQGVAAFLRRYKVREFIMRRWLMNRSRD